MIIDAHLHCSGDENSADILRGLDEAGVDAGLLIAPFLNAPYTLDGRNSLQQANLYLSRITRAEPSRLIGFAVVNPLHPEAPDDLEKAITEYNLRGLKLVPAGWYPYDECAHRVYERAADLNIPILFHSGIFIDGKSGRFCRPTFYEAIREHPSLRVTLAHLGFPWCDESNAVGLIDRINGVSPEKSQFRFDISFGAPPVYRQQVLRNALSVLGPELLQFGSDRFFPCGGDHIKTAIEEVISLLNEIEVDKLGIEQIMGGTAANWLGIA